MEKNMPNTTLEKQKEVRQKIFQSEREAAENNENGIVTCQLVVFKLANEEYALRIEEIKEVVLTPGITHIPQVPEYIRGVANVRGNILAIVDLQKRLGIEGESMDHSRFTLVLDDENHKVGILVQEVPNTVSIAEKNLDASNPYIQESAIEERAIQALAKIDGRLIILLNIKNILAPDEALLLQSNPHSPVSN